MNRYRTIKDRFRPIQSGRGVGHRFRGVDFQQGHGEYKVRYRRNADFRNQYGDGIQWFSNIYRWFKPGMNLVKSYLPKIGEAAKEVGKDLLSSAKDQVITSGKNFLGDVISGENVLKSAKSRLNEAGGEFVHNAADKLADTGLSYAVKAKRKLSSMSQSGSGVVKRRKVTSKKSKKKVFGKRKTVKKTAKSRRKKRNSRKSEFGVVRPLFKQRAKLPYKTIFDV